MKAAGGAIAKAMSNHRLFEELAADSEGPEFVGIFEDDLLLTSEAHEVKQRIRDALKQLPPSADVLYLEVSWESCKDIRFNHEHPAIVRAARPSGSAAHVFTRKGILKMLQVIGQQPWHWYDLMCTHAISAGLLEAYMTMPPCFVQDGWFGSNYQRSSEMPNVWHDPRAEMTLNSESGAGDSTGRSDRGSAARAAAKSVRIHQPVYPVCVEHFFSPMTPFSTMVFTEAHVLSHVHALKDDIVSRTLVVRNAYFEMGSDANQVFYTETAPNWQDRYMEGRMEFASEPLVHQGIFNGAAVGSPYVRLPVTSEHEGGACLELSLPPASSCWKSTSDGPGTTLGPCTIFVVRDMPEHVLDVKVVSQVRAIRVVFMVDGGEGCGDE
jgi:hypothetical protein